MKIDNKHKPMIIAGVGLVIVMCAGIIIGMRNSGSPPPSVPPSLENVQSITTSPEGQNAPLVTGKQSTLTGEVECLPPALGLSQVTLMCAYGLKTDDGNHYELRNLDQQLVVDNTIAVGQKYTVTGVLLPGDSKQFNVVGAIQVASIVKK